MSEVAQLISEYGFPIVMMVGLGYFIYYIWWFVGNELEPEIEKQHMALIRLIDQVRMLDQDLIRLQQKVNVASSTVMYTTPPPNIAHATF